MRPSSYENSDESGLRSKNLPPWESLRECASDTRMRIARELMKSHNVQHLPALSDKVLLCKADCGASAAASLSSLLDKVLTEHASTVPSRKELIAQQHQRTAAAAKAAREQLRPAGMRMQGKSVSGLVADKVDTLEAAAAGPKRVGMWDISEGEADKAMEWENGAASLRQYDRVTIKSRTHSRRGNMACRALRLLRWAAPAL